MTILGENQQIRSTLSKKITAQGLKNGALLRWNRQEVLQIRRGEFLNSMLIGCFGGSKKGHQQRLKSEGHPIALFAKWDSFANRTGARHGEVLGPESAKRGHGNEFRGSKKCGKELWGGLKWTTMAEKVKNSPVITVASAAATPARSGLVRRRLAVKFGRRDLTEVAHLPVWRV